MDQKKGYYLKKKNTCVKYITNLSLRDLNLDKDDRPKTDTEQKISTLKEPGHSPNFPQIAGKAERGHIPLYVWGKRGLS